MEEKRDIYMITNPRYRIVRIDTERGQPMQSAAKCPILVQFICEKFEGPDHYYEKLLAEKRKKRRTQQHYFQENFNEADDEQRDHRFIKYLEGPMKVKGFPVFNSQHGSGEGSSGSQKASGRGYGLNEFQTSDT